ncbi:MAG: CPBP family intramembrane metalloprotease [Silvanigrellales bacterium]|nr:CPBP family intramembrane metalloprotease [Silvanigrellales bacterium]
MEPHVKKRRLEGVIIACVGPRSHVLGNRDGLTSWASSAFLFGVLAFGLAPLLSDLLPKAFVWRAERLPALLATVPFKAFKEEILFRSLPFFLLANTTWPRRQRPVMSHGAFVLVSSTVFVLAHEFNFRYLREDPLSLSTLGTLGFFGLLTGTMFVKQGHLLGCLALHAGWNVMRFQVDMTSEHGQVLSETAGFNFLEGSWMLLSLTGVVACVLFRSQFPTDSHQPRRQSEEPLSMRAP